MLRLVKTSVCTCLALNDESQGGVFACTSDGSTLFYLVCFSRDDGIHTLGQIVSSTNVATKSKKNLGVAGGSPVITIASEFCTDAPAVKNTISR